MRMQTLLDELCDTTPKHLDGLCEQLGQDEDLSGLRREDILDGYWMTAHFHPLWTLYGEFLKLFPSAVCPAAAAELDVMLDDTAFALGAGADLAWAASAGDDTFVYGLGAGEPVARAVHAKLASAVAAAAEAQAAAAGGDG